MFRTLRALTTGTQRGFQAVYTALTDCCLQDPERSGQGITLCRAPDA